MVLKSSSVSDSAKANDVIAVAADLSEATRQFKERYKYLPGDDPLASSQLPNVAVAQVGDGNGLIDFDALTNLEPSLAPLHLFQAGLIRVSADPGNAVTGISLRSHFGTVWLMSFAMAATPAGSGGGSTPCGVSIFGGSPPVQLNSVVFANIPAGVAQQIDAKYDDGFPNTGAIRASGYGINPTQVYDTTSSAPAVACFAMPL